MTSERQLLDAFHKDFDPPGWRKDNGDAQAFAPSDAPIDAEHVFVPRYVPAGPPGEVAGPVKCSVCGKPYAGAGACHVPNATTFAMPSPLPPIRGNMFAAGKLIDDLDAVRRSIAYAVLIGHNRRQLAPGAIIPDLKALRRLENELIVRLDMVGGLTPDCDVRPGVRR